MEVLLYSLLSAFLVSLISFIGLVTLCFKKKNLDKFLLVLVGFAAGGLMGGAFFHLLPEALEKSLDLSIFVYFLVGFIFFFLMERVLHWRHCHDEKCEVHAFAYMNLFGDAVHNLIDGLVIVSAFFTNTALGISTTLAVVLHEIPQEIGEFGVLVYGGFTKRKALMYNFLSALLAVFGVVVGYLLFEHVSGLALYLLPFAAGGFTYIAASDLVPELHKEKELSKSVLSLFFFLLGICLMYASKILLASV